MKKMFIFIFCVVTLKSAAMETITFPSKDGITITGDLYISNDSLPYMLLCHQAGYSRGEYKETAKRFNKLGYNCLAIDQRSGGEINGIINQTNAEAKKAGKGTDYLDAEQDIVAALDYLYKKSGKEVVLVGSSYSASLVLKIAVGNPKVSRVLAFSPGEYFGKKMTLKKEIEKLDKPVWIGSSFEEKAGCEDLIKNMLTGDKKVFAPSEKGEHGSKALWKTNSNYLDYWMSIMMFLDND